MLLLKSPLAEVAGTMRAGKDIPSLAPGEYLKIPEGRR
jgi:hypothetical protein